MGRYIAGADVLVCGASYRQDVGDTRYSGSEMVVRKLTEMGAEMRVHDPYVDHWYELETQDVYPAPGHSWSRFFRNQEGLRDIRVQKDLAEALEGRRGSDPGRPARAVPGTRSRPDRQMGRRRRWRSSIASASFRTRKSGAISNLAARSKPSAADIFNASKRGPREEAGPRRANSPIFAILTFAGLFTDEIDHSARHDDRFDDRLAGQ